MRILTISGSVRPDSSNIQFLNFISSLTDEHQFLLVDYLHQIPLFCPQLKNRKFKTVEELKQNIEKADLVIISTPEYLHNIPASLKNAFEWMTESGVFEGKKVIAFTYTPHAPRGEKAMSSILNTLRALNSRIILSEQLYQDEYPLDNPNEEFRNMILESINLAI